MSVSYHGSARNGILVRAVSAFNHSPAPLFSYLRKGLHSSGQQFSCSVSQMPGLQVCAIMHGSQMYFVDIFQTRIQSGSHAIGLFFNYF